MCIFFSTRIQNTMEKVSQQLGKLFLWKQKQVKEKVLNNNNKKALNWETVLIHSFAEFYIG